MIERIHYYRFELFLLSQVLVLFGSLVLPYHLYQDHLLPVLFIINITAGVNLVSRRKLLFWPLVLLLVGSFFTLGTSLVAPETVGNESFRLTFYFIFHMLVCYELIRQVWRAKEMDRHVIFGLMSGYISLGFVAFLIFATIELHHPGSFKGINTVAEAFAAQMDSLMYYAFITLLTIGYGDIVPVTPVAQKASILVGLSGQFYMVILTAVVVGKYLKEK